MRFELTVQGETDDVEHIKDLATDKTVLVESRTMGDVIKVLEMTLPYMLDNVVVTSKILESD